MTDFEKWYDENYLNLCYTAEENGLVYFQKCDLETAYEAGAEGYEKQKEINKELVDENEKLKAELEERKRYEEKLLRESFRAPQDEPPSDAEDDYPADYYDGDEYSEGL